MIFALISDVTNGSKIFNSKVTKPVQMALNTRSPYTINVTCIINGINALYGT